MGSSEPLKTRSLNDYWIVVKRVDKSGWRLFRFYETTFRKLYVLGIVQLWSRLPRSRNIGILFSYGFLRRLRSCGSFMVVSYVAACKTRTKVSSSTAPAHPGCLGFLVSFNDFVDEWKKRICLIYETILGKWQVFLGRNASVSVGKLYKALRHYYHMCSERQGHVVLLFLRRGGECRQGYLRSRWVVRSPWRPEA